MKTLYVVNCWVPFPESEYGGMHAVIALSDEESCGLLLREGFERDYWGARCMEQIKAADRFAIADEPSRVVRSFTT